VITRFGMPRKICTTVSILLAGGHFDTIEVPIGAARCAEPHAKRPGQALGP